MIGRTMVSALALMGVAHAQETAPPAPNPTQPVSSSDRVGYDAAFFASFNPQTALDMVRQTPGFSLNGGEDRRGFSGAVGNLLIDGERPTAKSQSLENILSQIPASQVVRIEVLRGAAVSGDASGQSTLLNVVRTPGAGSGVWAAGFEYNRSRMAPQASASWSGRAGQTEYGFGGSYYSQFRSLPGYRNLYDGSGTRTNFVNTPSPRNYREASLNANVATPVLGGRFAVTSQLNAFRFHAENGLQFYNLANTQIEDFLGDFTEHEWSFEVGLNYDHDFGPWATSLVGLVNRHYYANGETDTDRDGASALNFIAVQDQQRDRGETILRGTVSRSFTPAHRIEFGVEGAINTLDAGLQFVFDDGSGPVVSVIPNSNVTVEEKRSEVFGTYTWRPNDRWSVETRLAREASTLTFSGDTNQSVELAFIKPSVQVSRSIGEHNQLHLRYYRDVGQLNFDDFVSAASVIDNLITGGNPDLKPETAWRLEFGGDLRLPGGAALTFALTHHWISDAADVVQIITPNPGHIPDPIRFDAPGNIGEGEANSLTTHLTVPFSPLIPGAKLTFDGTFWQTSVTDPVTGRQRSISGRADADMSAEFRQDLNAQHLAWGIEYQKVSEQQYFRFNETDTQEEGPYVDLFVESTAIHGLKLKATAANVLGSPILRERYFYTPDRTGTLERFERRQRNFSESPWLIFEVSGTF